MTDYASRTHKTKSQIVKEYADAMGLPHIDIALIKERELEEEFENQLPEWAQAKADPNIIEGMQQLYTRDSERCGNATIVEIKYLLIFDEVQFIVATDAGTIMKLTQTELHELFILGKYILKDFPNQIIWERLREL